MEAAGIEEAPDDTGTLRLAGIRLLALTGCRLGEIVKLRWSEVDRAEPCLRLEDSKEAPRSGRSARPSC
ncbi:site-specific integrase [Methylobacterium radiotolerans]|jgi:integrase|uniref:site-specific integrase n=1 Tax=Methylobacterium radiotolerans TaxID=31998 RepID=UPI0005E0D786|nr:site-specific integrase [Methylobacterium radiotolerans]OXE40641.1 hypothetical protein CCS92_17820 [Methylobacterium radiotolerans]GAN52333.1 putative integrase [Methylobacterium sp. ME121]